MKARPDLTDPELFRRLIDQSSDSIFVVDPDNSDILDINEQACRSLGYTRQELLELTMRDIEQAYDHFTWDEQVASARETGLELVETGQRRKTGEVFPVEISLKHVVLENGTYIVAAVRDITEKKQLEAKYLRAQRLESVGRLAGGIAHDLNNVLAPLLLSMGMLREKMPDPDTQELLDLVEAAAKRGAGMVKQILTFARGAKGERSAVQVEDVLKEIISLGRETFPRTIQLKCNVTPGLWVVKGDATQLHQVVINLCVNACDAMPDGGVLEIQAENRYVDQPRPHAQSCCAPGPYVRISIRDTGSGIPAPLLDKIFEPFFTTKAAGKGTGLGLATALGIVENHEGFISVESEVGKGSCFQVFLSAKEHAPAVEPQKPASPSVNGGARTVLLVEDEEPIRLITQKLLQAQNYRVLTACDGAEALAVFARRQPEIDAIIMDMNMPTMEGPSAIRALRDLNPRVRILAVSGYMDPQTLASKTGHSDIQLLLKPYTGRELSQKLGALLKEGEPG
jgi:two-component system, cell cycle sensor histidine kinase and response regulator CckA